MMKRAYLSNINISQNLIFVNPKRKNNFMKALHETSMISSEIFAKLFLLSDLWY